MSEVNSSVDKYSKLATDKTLKVCTPAEQFAIANIVGHVVNGSFWSAVEYEDVKKIEESLKEDRERGVAVRKLANGCLLEVTPKYLIDALGAVSPDIALMVGDLKHLSDTAAKAEADFESFLLRKGKDSRGFEGTIGIYCINSEPYLTYGGVVYPAFRVSLIRALMLLNRYGYKVQAGGRFINAKEAMGLPAKVLWGSLTMVPTTKNGVLVNIKSTLNRLEMESLERKLKGKA